MIHSARRPCNRSVYELAHHLEKGGTVPPIHVKQSPFDGSFWICDGRHRIEASKLIGKRTILARYAVQCKRHRPSYAILMER